MEEGPVQKSQIQSTATLAKPADSFSRTQQERGGGRPVARSSSKTCRNAFACRQERGGGRIVALKQRQGETCRIAFANPTGAWWRKARDHWRRLQFSMIQVHQTESSKATGVPRKIRWERLTLLSDKAEFARSGKICALGGQRVISTIDSDHSRLVREVCETTCAPPGYFERGCSK